MTSRYQTSPTIILFSLGLLIVLIAWTIPPSHAQGQIQVNAADPPAAEQGTINLNVKVTGKGFKNGAQAKWFVTGTTNPGGVTVNSTTFVSNTELTANITVADTATIANFDIQVLNADGRGGKGTELFAVTAKGNSANGCTVQPLPSGISLLSSFNYVTSGGEPAFGPSLGISIKARSMTLNTSQLIVVGVGTSGGVGKLEIFLVDPDTGQVLDGTVIGTGSIPQPHITVNYGAGARSLAVGDVNADGIPDFVAGSTATNSANAVVGSVTNGVLNYESYLLPIPANASNVGWGVAMGDLNGDGSDVIAVGATGMSPTGPGQVSLFAFNGSGFNNILNITSPLPNKTKDEKFGFGVAIADVTGSNAKDLVVGAPDSTISRATGTGRAFVFPGPVSAGNYLTLSSNIKGDGLGRKLAAGLVNGDGFNDLLATSYESAKLYTGLVTSGQSPAISLQPVSGLGTGWSTTEPDIADVNGDLLGDVLIGAPNAANGSICGGVAYLYLSSFGSPLSTRLTLTTPVLDTSVQVFGWATAFAPGTRLFFVTDHGLGVGSKAGAGQVYVFKVN